ncbi:MAG: 3-oxo-5-alpha-steroid 4-dehydrogenase [Treponema sp.]|nr:MAG: 3-oxo-5-alpha-steroid 4-dehydrogenase [Treponema sp.]
MDYYYRTYNLAMLGMAVVGLVCFVALFFVKAGYGKFRNDKWGLSFSNKAAWLVMEVPTIVVMLVMLFLSKKDNMLVRVLISFFFFAHYIQRTFVFPFLLKGKSKMPILIVLMGMTFNTVNALLIGSWLFHFSPDEMYSPVWLYSPQFIIGAVVFILGFWINVSSDSYIRSLRKPGDTAHYFPNMGMYRYVTSANYFGELVEWTGFAILSWSLPAALFVFWTAANLVPRAHAINKSYRQKFPEEFAKTKPKRIFPFVF